MHVDVAQEILIKSNTLVHDITLFTRVFNVAGVLNPGSMMLFQLVCSELIQHVQE